MAYPQLESRNMLQPFSKRGKQDAQRESIKKLVEKMDDHLKKGGVISKVQSEGQLLNRDLEKVK